MLRSLHPTLPCSSTPPSELLLRIERLESRRMLSGNVMATIAGGDLLLLGDDADNILSIEWVDNDVILVGNPTTTVNGSHEAFVLSKNSPRFEGEVKAILANGNDQLVIGEGVQIEQSVIIFSGPGDNSVGVGDSVISGDLKIYSHSGSNQVALDEAKINGTFLNFSGRGDDLVSIVNSTISGNVKLRGGNGDDGILIDSTNIGGDLLAATGAGNDDFVVRFSEVAGKVIGVMGRGDDFHYMETSKIDGKTVIAMNSGNDEIIYLGANQIFAKHLAAGGLGFDRFEWEPATEFFNRQLNLSNESNQVLVSTTEFRLNDPLTGLFSRSTAARQILQTDPVSPLTLQLDTSANPTLASNGVMLTKDSTFMVNGTTSPGASVKMDTDGDGNFDDGSALASKNGSFSISTQLVHDSSNWGLNEIKVQATNSAGESVSESLSVHYAIGDVVRFDNEFGAFDVELSADPGLAMTVNNFLSYQSQYENSILHRSATTLTGDPFVIQGGGFRIDNGSVKRIVTEAPVPNQFNANNSNIRGTVAMALPQGNPDGGTSQWFINLADGNEVLDDSLYTVFGRVIGTGMDVVDALHGIPKSNIVVPASDDALFEVPLTDFEEFTIPITGTVSALSAETKLTGNGTRFLSELAPRGEIKIGNQQYVIRSINSDLELELQVGPVSNISGATALVNALPDIEDYVVFRSVQVVFPQDST